MKQSIASIVLALSLALFLTGTALATDSVATQTVATLAQSEGQLTPEQAATIGQSFSASLPSGIIYEVDGVIIDDPYLEVFNGTTYISLGTMLSALRPDATLSWSGSQAVVYAEGLSITATPGNDYLEANGRIFLVNDSVMSSGNALLLPIRVAVEVLGASLTWDESAQLISVQSGTGATVSGDEYYDQDVLYWLSRIIQAESGSEPLSGKIAVGTVIYNRVADSRFPNSVYGVIFQSGQFSPVSNGLIYNTPNSQSILAAKLCMEGMRMGGDSLYFLAHSATSSSWVRNSLTYVTTISNHIFYK